MGARSRMTMRCDTERAVKQTNRQDTLGDPITNDIAILTGQPCYWQARRAQIVEDPEQVVVVTVHRMMFPLTADIQEKDFVTCVRDRRDRVLQGHRMRVLSAPRLENHIDVSLEEYR